MFVTHGCGYGNGGQFAKSGAPPDGFGRSSRSFPFGGLDSSSVVAFARELDPEIRCFTIEVVGGQESGTTDDLPYARRVAEHLGVSLDVVRIDAGRMADDLQRMVIQLDEPLADPAPLNVLYISQLARDQGIKVLLSGAGGDDLFTGYRRHRLEGGAMVVLAASCCQTRLGRHDPRIESAALLRASTGQAIQRSGAHGR